MLSLVDYSSSEESDNIDEKNNPLPILQKEIPQLPLPLRLTNNLLNSESQNDKPEDHSGRIRSFPHERGNWATYGDLNDSILELQNDIINFCDKTINISLQKVPNIHISLTRTVVLRHHWIDQFIMTVKSKLIGFKRSLVDLNNIKVYRNDEKTRTFIGLCISPENQIYFLKLMKIFDSCLKEYNLPVFYSCPSFHLSILWCLGDHLDVLQLHLDKLNQILTQIYEDNQTDFFLNITTIQCKSGNRLFQFDLK